MNLPRKHLEASLSSRKSFSFGRLFSAMVLVLTASLAACGGGSSGGGSSPSASSVSGIYSGGTTTAYFHILRLVDTVYATSPYSPGTFSLALNSNNKFALTDQQGNQGGGTYSISGSSISLTGTMYLTTLCTSKTATCTYAISSSGMTIGSSGGISGTIDLSSGGAVVYSSSINVSPVTVPSVSLTKLEGQSFTSTFGSTTSPGPLACSTASTFSGTVSASVNGSSFYIPCLTWDTFPVGSDNSSGYFVPTNGADFTMTFCSSIGTDCTPYTESGRTYITLTSVPSNALVFYITTTYETNPTPCGTPSNTSSNCSIGVNGYIEPFSGSGGGVLGNFFAQSYYTGTISDTWSGVANIIVSTSGSTTGTYLFGDGLIPSSTTAGGYTVYPVGLSMFSSTQF